MLKIDNISVNYENFSLNQITMDISKGEYFVILGNTGAGKSVLLEAIAGIVTVSSGRIFLDSVDITNEKIQSRKVALVPQGNSLFPHKNVLGNISYPLEAKGVPKSAINEKIEELSSKLHIKNILFQNVNTLSGGEYQKVTLARAIASEPKMLLLDEPISSLDIKSRTEIRAILRKLNREGMTILHVTHDIEETISLAHRIAILENGKLTHIGTPEDVFKQPKSELVANFAGIKNFFAGEIIHKNTNTGTAEFRTKKLVITIPNVENSDSGYIILRNEDIFISAEKPDTSARNTFEGVVIDIIPQKLGIEVVIDAREIFSALITKVSAESMGIKIGSKIWIGFKASSVKFIPK